MMNEDVKYLNQNGTEWVIDKVKHQNFKGTQDEWNSLSDDEKKSYDTFDITDSNNNIIIVTDEIAEGNMNPITSNAVFGIHKTSYALIEKKDIDGLTLTWRDGITGSHYAYRNGNICSLNVSLTVTGTFTGTTDYVDLWTIPSELFHSERVRTPSFANIVRHSDGTIGDIRNARSMYLENGKTYDFNVQGQLILFVLTD